MCQVAAPGCQGLLVGCLCAASWAVPGWDTGQGAAGLCTPVGHPGSRQEGEHEGKRQMERWLLVATPVLRAVQAAKALPAPSTHHFGSTFAPDGGFHQAEAEKCQAPFKHHQALLHSRYVP